MKGFVGIAVVLIALASACSEAADKPGAPATQPPAAAIATNSPVSTVPAAISTATTAPPAVLATATRPPAPVVASTVAPQPPATATAVSQPQGAACPQGCLAEQPGCVIKGNINAEGVKIYHVPGGGSYTATVIATSAGERWFCTGAEAEANGWRRAQN